MNFLKKNAVKVKNHFIGKIIDINNKRLIQLRNPWGNTESKIKWSDDCYKRIEHLDSLNKFYK